MPKGYFHSKHNSWDHNKLAYEFNRPAVEYLVSKNYQGYFDCRREILILLFDVSSVSRNRRPD